MNNPRPCVCGHLESDHAANLTDDGSAGVCYRCYPSCLRYDGVRRWEPLRSQAVCWCGDGRHAAIHQPQPGFVWHPFSEVIGPGNDDQLVPAGYERCPEIQSDDYHTTRCEHEAGHAGRHRSTFLAPGALEWWEDAAAS